MGAAADEALLYRSAAFELVVERDAAKRFFELCGTAIASLHGEASSPTEGVTPSGTATVVESLTGSWGTLSHRC